MLLSPKQIRNYKSDGFLSGIPIAIGPDVKKYRDNFNEIEKIYGREKCEIGLIDHHFQHKFIWELATHPKILDCVSALIGDRIMLLATHFFCKYGTSEKFVAWHQDITYWGLEPPEATTVWFAIDDSDTENGCMQVIPKSHQLDILEHGKSDQKGNLLSINQSVSIGPEMTKTAIDLTLKAGEISIHDGKLLHGSQPNRSDCRRCGLTIRYITPEVKPIHDHPKASGWRVILLRGDDPDCHFRKTPKPFDI